MAAIRYAIANGVITLFSISAAALIDNEPNSHVQNHDFQLHFCSVSMHRIRIT